MTNKHKSAEDRKVKRAAKAAKIEAAYKASEPSPSLPEPEMRNFTRAQIAALIFVYMGYSKLSEFSTALSEGTEDPKSCLRYLGEVNEETCRHDGFQGLMLAKYNSGIILFGLVVTMVLALWHSELNFLKFMMCLCVSPLFTTVIGIFASREYLITNRIWHMLILCSVLFTTSAPQNMRQLAFAFDRPISVKSVQSLTLMALALSCSFEIGRVLINPGNSYANSLIETETPLPDAAGTLINFWIVDKLSMAILYLFAVVHFEPNNQRVSILPGEAASYSL